jgi:hypothetical protein
MIPIDKKTIAVFLLGCLLGGLAVWGIGCGIDGSGADEARANLREARRTLDNALEELARSKQVIADLEAENKRAGEITADLRAAYTELERLYLEDRAGDEEFARLVEEGRAILKRAREREQAAQK